MLEKEIRVTEPAVNWNIQRFVELANRDQDMLVLGGVITTLANSGRR